MNVFAATERRKIQFLSGTGSVMAGIYSDRLDATRLKFGSQNYVTSCHVVAMDTQDSVC
jgi:hypothetical protein